LNYKKTVTRITYTVLVETLNPAQSIKSNYKSASNRCGFGTAASHCYCKLEYTELDYTS